MRIFWFFYNIRWGKKRVSIYVSQHLCGDQSPHKGHLVHKKHTYGPCAMYWCEGKKR